MIQIWLGTTGGITAALLLAAGLIHLLPKIGLGPLAAWFSRAPGLDIWIFYFTVLPLFVGPVLLVRLAPAPADALLEAPPIWLGMLLGLAASIVAQVASVLIWCRLHELANRKAIQGPRLVSQINTAVSPWRNHLAVWWTAWAVPLFALCRVVQYLVYPPLTWWVKLPKYKTGEWVNVSRHKFDGLVGHDLIWCLYCDWMTGVWSLGTEMLRNVESFWCPIRFRSDKKCENCTIDFPDLDNGWAPADGSMADAVRAHAEHYPGPNGDNQWFGHPARLTVEGEAPKDRSH
ncbi:MAG: hypothetical protein AAGB51_11690 [Planctomycetota bacterium]